MGKATSKAAGKQRAELVSRVVRAMDADSDEPTRLWQTASALGSPRDPDAAREALATSNHGGVTRSWLAVVAGSATADDIRAVADMAATSKSARLVLAEAMHLIADQLDTDVVMRAAENLDGAAPFAPFMLDHGRRAALTTGRTELAAVLQARQGFMQRHGETLADLRNGVQEKKQVEALAAIQQLSGADRDHVLLYLIGDTGVTRDAQRWTRVESVANPAIPVLLVAFALNSEYGIYDEEEKELGKRLAAAGEAGVERAAAILTTAIERTMVHALDHLAEACPQAFAHPSVFGAIMKAFPENQWVRTRLCEDARHWVKHLTHGQAAQFAHALIEQAEAVTHTDHALGRAFFYFRNPGGLDVFADALKRTITYYTRDEVYDAIYQIPDPRASDILIDRLWHETEAVRDLVFSFHELCVPRHAEILARLDREPSFHAAWIYGGCQTNWANRPRFLLDVIERVLAWPVSGDPARRAYMMSCGVKAALELRRYPLAKRLLTELGDAQTADSPGDREPVKTLLADDKYTDPLKQLTSGALEAEQQKLLAEVDTLRAAGTPRVGSDDRLGLLAGVTVAVRLHEHAKTREVWFFDTEGVFHFYDGYGIAPPPFDFAVHALVNPWDPTCTSLAAVTADWRTEARSLHRAHSSGVEREVLLSGPRLMLRFHGNHSQYSAWRVFVVTFTDVVVAARMFDALSTNPVASFSVSDPFYVPGKKGGGWVRRYGGDIRASCVGTTLRWGDTETEHDSPDDALAAYEMHETERIRLGDFPRQIELNDQLRPATDMPMHQFFKDRYRDDDKNAIWHVQALPAFRSALARSELSLDEVEVELGPPASAEDLAAYDAALPEPMHPDLRALWQSIGHASWRVADKGMRLLSPGEVLARRQELRDELAVRVSTLRQQRQRDAWPISFLDVLVTDGDTAVVAWDIRQQEKDCFDNVQTERLAHPWRSGLGYVLSESFNADFVEAIKEQFPETKKLMLGQSVAELGGKGKGAAKPAATAKPVAKAKAKPAAKAKATPAAKAKPAAKGKSKPAAKAKAKPTKGTPAAKKAKAKKR